MLSSAASVMALATLTSNAQNLAQNGQTSGTPTTPPDSKTNSISQFALDRFAGVSLMNGFDGGLPDNRKRKSPSRGAGNSTAVHVKVDGSNKPYTCKVCGRRFTDRSNCIKHQFIHTGLKPFECPHCGKRFRRKDHLNSHSKSQHGEEAFPPGVPAPRLSIVAATQALPNMIGTGSSEADSPTSLINSAPTMVINSKAGISTTSALFGQTSLKNEHNDEPDTKKLKIEDLNADPDEDRLIIEEIDCCKSQEDFSKQESEIEVNVEKNDENLKIEPTEPEQQEIGLQKELYDRIMNE